MRKCISAAAIILMVITGCATVDISVQYDEAVDFSIYKTYRLQRPDVRRRGRQKMVNNPIFAKEVLQEIKPIMASKGFTEAKQGQKADLLIIFYAHTRNEIDWVPGTYRTGRWGRVWKASPGHTVRYKTGTLVIDIVDRANKELVWQGVGEGALDRKDPTRKLVDAVEKILEKFPPM